MQAAVLEVFDITATIPFNKNKMEKPDLLKKADVLLNDSDKKIVARMKANGSIKMSEISRQTGLGMTTITKRIRRLKEEGMIEREG